MVSSLEGPPKVFTPKKTPCSCSDEKKLATVLKKIEKGSTGGEPVKNKRAGGWEVEFARFQLRPGEGHFSVVIGGRAVSGILNPPPAPRHKRQPKKTGIVAIQAFSLFDVLFQRVSGE